MNGKMKMPRVEGKQLRHMIVMLVAVGVIFGIVFGYKAWQEQRMKRSMTRHRCLPWR